MTKIPVNDGLELGAYTQWRNSSIKNKLDELEYLLKSIWMDVVGFFWSAFFTNLTKIWQKWSVILDYFSRIKKMMSVILKND